MPSYPSSPFGFLHGSDRLNPGNRLLHFGVGLNPESPSRQELIQELFEQTARLEPARRAAFLREACGEDVALKSEIERLVLVAGTGSLSVGQVLNHYRVIGPLGAGGMGEVWEAEDSKLKRRVAIKVLPPDLAASQERLQRFRREAEAIAALNHPNIVTIHSVEETDGTHFLSMEKVEGESLDRLIPDGGFDLDRLFKIAVPVAAAVSAAHEKGITHRDLKPANIMVTGDGHVKVLDFGLAKIQDSEDPVPTQMPTEGLTSEGAIMGTASYMSPEQAEGRLVDHRSDIFSLGVILYEMVSGQRPFQGSSSIAVMSAILRDRPQPLAEIRPEIPRHLGRIISECLEKDPRDRSQSARDVYNGLRRLRQEVSSDPSWTESTQEPGSVAQRGARGPALAAAAVILTAVILGVWWWSSKDPGDEIPGTESGQAGAAPERQMVAVLPMKNLGDAADEFFAAGITDEILSRLATVKGLGVVSVGTETSPRGSARIGALGQELGVDYILTGSVRWASSGEGASRVRISPKLISVEDETHLWAEVYDRSIDDIFEIQTEIALSVVRELGAALLEPEREAIESRPTENLEAYQAYMRGIWAADSVSCEFIRSRVVYLHRATELDASFAEAWAHASRAHSAAFAHCPERAAEDRLEALRTLDRARALAPDSWFALEAEGKFLTQVERDYPAALEVLRQANELVDRWEIKFSLGRIYRRMGAWDQALEASNEALTLFPLNVELIMRVGAIHHWMRNYPEALRYYDRATEEGPTWNNTFVRKAWVYWLWKADLGKARGVLEALPPTEPSPGIQWSWFWQRFYEGDFQGAVEGLEVLPGDRLYGADIFVAPRQLLAAQAYEQMGETERARRAYEESRIVLERETERAPHAQSLLQSLAVAYAGLCRAPDAGRILDRLHALVPFESEPYYGGTVLLAAALVHTKSGNYALAIEQLESILAVPAVVSIPMLKLDPRWAPLRELPEFARLEREFGEP